MKLAAIVMNAAKGEIPGSETKDIYPSSSSVARQSFFLPNTEPRSPRGTSRILVMGSVAGEQF